MANDNFHHQNCGCSLHRKMEQDIYFSEEWRKGAEETRRSLAEGNGITFPNAKEAIKWLKQGEETTRDNSLTFRKGVV